MAVVGGDTVHGGLPWLVSPPASERQFEMHPFLFGKDKNTILDFRFRNFLNTNYI